MSVLLYEKHNQIAYITLNRPEVLNSFNDELNTAIGEALVDYREDPSLLVAILSGTGRAFSTGADLKELVAKGGSAGGRQLNTPLMKSDLPEWPGNMKEVWKPIIAAIDGYAVAGGFHLALECDIRLATVNSRLGDIESRISAWGGRHFKRMVKMMPFGEAMHMLLTGTHMSAEEAYRIGLVHKVVENRDDLMREAESIAEEIKQCAPLAVQAVRRLAYTSFMKSGRELDELNQVLKKGVSETEDAQEGPRAFAEKRKPIWKMH
jgi:enoyl-CoA hydratase/carnithine racemase